MEEEARQILQAALADASGPAENIVARIRSRFSGLGGVELAIPAREPVRAPPQFGGGPQPAEGRSGSAAAKRPATRRRK
jgi:hypothetical protein